MNDKVTMWSVWLTALCMIAFAGIALQISGSGVRKDIYICGMRQNGVDSDIELLRIRVQQLEKVNAKQLKKAARSIHRRPD